MGLAGDEAIAISVLVDCQNAVACPCEDIKPTPGSCVLTTPVTVVSVQEDHGGISRVRSVALKGEVADLLLIVDTQKPNFIRHGVSLAEYSP